mmetsp:Transcript_23782/g.50576  ORF Transcript_23782/g.50576 Transcript_23782/m.50576 type:complete len:86 (-) Transcript_23782:1646-1903(-)
MGLFVCVAVDTPAFNDNGAHSLLVVYQAIDSAIRKKYKMAQRKGYRESIRVPVEYFRNQDDERALCMECSHIIWITTQYCVCVCE